MSGEARDKLAEERFAQIVMKFAAAYTKQNRKDYKRFMKAIASGELPCAENGL